MENTIP